MSDDQFDAEVVSSFSGAAVGPLIRGGGGAEGMRSSASLVYVLSALALIPIVGLIFAFAALAVALLDLASSRRAARTEILVAAVATMASVVIAMLVI